MTTFDNREQAFENKFKHDEELRFKVNARAVALFGRWAAQKLDLAAAEIEAYVEAVIDSDFDEPGIQDVLRKVLKDFEGKGLSTDLAALEREFHTHLELAKGEAQA